MSLQKRREQLRAALAAPRPSVLWQDPYDGDPLTLQRVVEGRAEGRDWDAYVEAVRYGDPFQPELFVYLLPDLLAEWEGALMDRALGDTVPDVLTECLPSLGSEGVAAVAEYLAAATLDAFDGLMTLGAAIPAYRWQAILATAGAIPGAMSRLLPAWLGMGTPGRSLALLQFASCLLYRDDANPLFRRWTPEEGGGPPTLWEGAGFTGSRGWERSNLAALDEALSPARLIGLLPLAAERVPAEDRALARHVLDELPLTRHRLELRWPVLLHLLIDHDSSLGEDWNAVA